MDEWRQRDELAAIAAHECTSVGILAHVDEDRLMVAGSWDDVDGGYACTMIVPLKAVLSVRVITEAKREEGG